MTNVDVAALAAELRHLLPEARLEKAYQPAKDEVLLRFRRKGVGRIDLLVRLGRFVTVLRRSPDNPDQPSMVAKVLRKDLGNARVKDVQQVGFDRLLRIDLERGDGRRAVVLELFGDGNLLLLDADDTIALPMRGAEHGARRLKKGEPYQPPPGSAEPFALDAEAFRQAGQAAKRDVVRFLALDLGFGPQWAEELCARAGVDKNTPVGEAAGADWDALHTAVQALGDDIARNDLAPGLVHEDGEPVDAVPFPLETYPPPRFQMEETATFREALETFFLGAADDEESDDPRRTRYEEAKGKLERQLGQMEGAMAGFEDEEQERRLDGDLLYARFQEVQALLDDLQKAREDRSWQEIAGRIAKAREEGRPEAQAVQAIHPHEGTAVLRLEDLEGMPRDVTVDLRKSVQENADALYEAGKKARSRREGAAKAQADVRHRLKDLEAKGLDAFGAAPKKAQVVRRHFWFEPFRWTVTPNGFLAVGGRNASQNDTVVKKYLRDGDRYVHATIHGAPSVVVRPADGSVADEVPDEDLRAAGQFAVCASRAWRQFGEASAYWVTPQQVSKTPRSGEFVPKGAWIVHGKRNGLDKLPMRWAVGMARFNKAGAPDPDGDVEKLLGGPPEAVRAHAERLAVLEPGDLDPNDAAAQLAEHFDVDVEEAQGVLPAGPVHFVEGTA